MSYVDALTEAMTWLGEQPDTIFIGQTVAAGGAGISKTLRGVPKDKLVEFPVAENMQAGAAFGLALAGFVPICIYPRIDFVLLALDAIVNHIDKIPEMSEGKMKPRIIIRTSIGPKEPLDGGPQHTQDLRAAISAACINIYVQPLYLGFIDSSPQILKLYKHAYYNRDNVPATLFVETGAGYA